MGTGSHSAKIHIESYGGYTIGAILEEGKGILAGPNTFATVAEEEETFVI